MPRVTITKEEYLASGYEKTTRTEYDLPENIIWTTGAGTNLFMSWNSHFQAYVTDAKDFSITPETYIAYMKISGNEEKLNEVGTTRFIHKLPSKRENSVDGTGNSIDF